MQNASIDKKLVESYERILAGYYLIFEEIYNREVIKKIKEGRIAPENSTALNEILAEYLYGNQIFNLLKKRDLSSLSKLYLKNKTKLFCSKKEVIKDILSGNKIITVLVRPESYYFSTQIENFLKNNIGETVHTYNIQINFNQYWLMYNHALTDINSWMDLPTRTLLYINNPCRLLVLKLNQDNQLKDIGQFSRRFKGEMGHHAKGTLRGDFLYNEFLRITANFFSYRNMALSVLDPLCCYRHLAGGGIQCDNAHINSDSPFLFYAGAGIHIPDADEVEKDLAALCDLELLKKIKIDIKND